MPTMLVPLGVGEDVLVGRFPVVVGRHPGCDVRVESAKVSRRHCTLVEVDGAVFVRDLGSTNGVRINGRRVTSGWLRPGDAFEVAHVRFRVVDLLAPVPAEKNPTPRV